MSINKYQRQKEQYSVDGGITWFDVTPPNYRAGILLEYDSDDCNEPIITDGEYLTTEMLEDGEVYFDRYIWSGGTITQTPLTNIAYSKNNGVWTNISYNENVNVSRGDVIRWKANGYLSSNVYSTTIGELVSRFVSTASFNAYGNMKSLLYGDNFTTFDETNYLVNFMQFFLGSKIVNAKNLSMAENIAENCYNFLFSDCSLLTIPPKVLPATTLTKECYAFMFLRCRNLLKAPELPATTLAINCYNGMFYDCTSLVTAPELPATTLATWCYHTMFSGCSSLVNVPNILPATTLAMGCYMDMFYECTSLVTAPELPATTLAEYCYGSMFQGCSSLVNAPVLPATTLVRGCYSIMFQLCSSLHYIKCLATDISAEDCTNYWVNIMPRTGTFVKAPSMTSWTTGQHGIPYGWTVQDASE